MITPKGKGALYVRVSNDTQDAGRQYAAAKEWCKLHGVNTITQYEDIGGSRDMADRRQGFTQLMADAEAGIIDWILVDAQDRFGTKNQWEFASYINRLQIADVDLFTIDGKCLTDDDISNFLIGGINANQSSKEQHDKAWRGMGKKPLQAKNGRWQGSVPPYGIDVVCFNSDNVEKWRVEYVAKDHRIKIFPNGDNEEFTGKRNFPAKENTDYLSLRPSKNKAKLDVVKLVFNIFATESIAKTAIAHRLNDMGIAHSSGKLWDHWHIDHMLTNPIYIGVFAWNRTSQARFVEVEAGERKIVNSKRKAGKAVEKRQKDKSDWIFSDRLFEPIINPETFKTVQQKLNKLPKKKHASRSPSLFYGGLLYCANCGQPMVCNQQWNDYACSTYNNAVGHDRRTCKCERHPIKHDDIDRYVKQWLSDTGRELADFAKNDLDLLKPYEEKHLSALARYCEIKNEMLNQVGRKQAEAGQNPTLAYADRMRAVNPTSLRNLYHQWIGDDRAARQKELARLHFDHDQLTDKILNLSASNKRAIAKANEKLARLELAIEQHEASRDIEKEMQSAVADVGKLRGMIADVSASLSGDETTSRRKAEAVRQVIQRINVTFRLTGKARPKSEPVSIEIIPVDAAPHNADCLNFDPSPQAPT